jgi:hypothetical protein
VFKASDLGELINALPAMFGFPPQDSLVTLGMSGQRVAFGMRFDLADAEDIDLAADLAVRHVERQQGVDGAITLAIGEPLERGRHLVLAVEARLVRVRPVAGGWATDDRFWVSMPGGHPGGYSYRRTLEHPASVQAVWEGQEITSSRASLEASMRPVEGEERTRIEAAAQAAVDHFGGPLLDPERMDLSVLVASHVLPTLHDLRMEKTVPAEQVHRLAYLMTAIPIRDAAWGLITPQNARDFVRVWLHVARHAPHAWAPAAYSLAAFASWMCGDGAKSVMAAEQAQRLNPEYSMAALMLELATSGLSPRLWSAAS